MFSAVSANVTSFLPHIDYLATIGADVMAMQEVRLTEDAIKVANDCLQPYQVRGLWGKPQPIRRGTVHSTMDAKQGGVGHLFNKRHTLTSSPRTETGTHLYETGRWHSAAVRINASGLIVHIVSLYGFPRANEGGDEMEENESLLSNAFAEATSLGNVPVLVMGDFNVSAERSHVLSNLVTNGGWTDIGRTYATLMEEEPAPTFAARGISSRIDLAFGNLEAMRLVKSYEVMDVPASGIKGHKPIKVILDVSCPKAFALQPGKVRSFPFSNFSMSPEEIENLENDVMERYVDRYAEAVISEDVDRIWDEWCQMAETFLAERVAMETGLDSFATDTTFRGRGRSAYVQRVRLNDRGRVFEGVELHPEKRGLKKILSLISEISEIRAQAEGLHLQFLWDKIKHLCHEVLKYHKKCVLWSFSATPEEHLLNELKGVVENELLEAMAGGRARLVRKWKRDRNEKAKTVTGDLFRHFKPLEQTPLTILKKKDGTITGDTEEMDKILREEWLPIFAKHAGPDNPEPSPNVFMARFGHLIPQNIQSLDPLQAERITSAARKLPDSGAAGLDGWKPGDVKRLSSSILGFLVHLFDNIERYGRWPRSLCWASITLIPKGEGGEPLNLRPITVTPVIYRLWAALRVQDCMPWQEKWVHKGQHGARSKQSTTDALVRISLELESAVLRDCDMKGVAVDLSKAFDNVPVKITFEVMRKMGADPGLLRALEGMYSQVQRRFKIGRFVGETFRSTNGILQGCPISVMLLNALMMILHRAIGDEVTAESYVDDLTLLHESSDGLQRAMDTLADFMSLTNQQVNEKKTKVFGLRDTPNIRYQGVTLGKTDTVKILGVTWCFGEGSFAVSMKEKVVENICALAHRIRCAGLPFHLRVLLCGSLLMSKILYGIEVVDMTTMQERALRSSIVQAIWGKSDRARNPGLLFTIPVKGHVCDPVQAPMVRRLNAFHRIVKNDLEVLSRIRNIWSGKKRQRRFRQGGFVENLLYSVKRLGITDNASDETWVFNFGGEEHDPVHTAPKIWAHESRDAARKAVWHGIEKERTRGHVDTPWGLAGGVDLSRTMRVYHQVNSKQKGILRKILLGGVWTRARLSHLPDPPCSDQCLCGDGREDLEHLWWHCPLWQRSRDKFRDEISTIDLDDLPPVTRQLGIFIRGSSESLAWVHRMMINIFLMRYASIT